MSIEAWVSISIMALFNVLSTTFYIGVNKQMLSEVMRRVTVAENEKADKDTMEIHIRRLDGEQMRFDRELSSVRHDVKNLTQRGIARGGE